LIPIYIAKLHEGGKGVTALTASFSGAKKIANSFFSRGAANFQKGVTQSNMVFPKERLRFMRAHRNRHLDGKGRRLQVLLL
jgi:hypothetical protein